MLDEKVSTSSSVQVWNAYQEKLGDIAPHLIKFCNEEEHSIEKRAMLAASIILNANCYIKSDINSMGCFQSTDVFANRVRIENSQKLKQVCGDALPSADQLIDLMKTENGEKTYLKLVQSIDDQFLVSIVKMQPWIIESRAKKFSNYSDQDLERLSCLLKSWPHSLAENSEFHAAFQGFWGKVLHFALNDLRRPANPSQILSFLKSNPGLFPQAKVIEILEVGIKACKDDIESYEKSNQDASEQVKSTGLVVLENIQAYIKENNLLVYFPDLT